MFYRVEMAVGVFESADREEARTVNRENPGSSMYPVYPEES